jgi:hypothetical protein
MKQFIYDMIHMTEGERLINYWWLWLTITVVGVTILYFRPLKYVRYKDIFRGDKK